MRFRKLIQEHGLPLSWAIALTATVGSLYFSEVLGYIPCNLCWYQRILMYPLVIWLGIAAVRKDTRIPLYVLPVSVFGGSISLTHYIMEKGSLFANAPDGVCGASPCDAQYINWFGFVTIPFLALTAFFLITVLQIAVWKTSQSR